MCRAEAQELLWDEICPRSSSAQINAWKRKFSQGADEVDGNDWLSIDDYVVASWIEDWAR